MDNYDIEQAVNTYIYMVERKTGSKNNTALIQDTLAKYLEKQVNGVIECDVEFSHDQMEAIYILNEWCSYQALYDNEVVVDIRKLGYVTNQNLRKALVAFGLTAAMINPLRRQGEDKEFFENNITIQQTTSEHKKINFGIIMAQRFLDTVNYEIVDDWKIFADKKGMGIKSLIDFKTELNGLDDFYQGGDSVYLFARFQRKAQEILNKDTKKAKDSAQEAFRNSLVSSIANKYTEQQMLEGKTIDEMMAMVETLFLPSQNSFTKNTKKIAAPQKNNQKRIGHSRKR